MWKYLLAVFLFTCLFTVNADSTQQYNKIYLDPFYRNSLTNNQNHSYSFFLSPPDRISSITSAIISFDVYLNPSVNFSLWVNDKQCNTRSFYVSTTFAGAGQARISFDCTNVIDSAGFYSVVLRPSGSNTGAVSGWVEAVYMNNPVGQVKYVGGTDYYYGETATIFLQLQDTTGAAVNNASCNFDMYNTTNPLLAPIYWKQPMVFRGADGIYYYQFSTASLTEGVYPVDAECQYVYDNFYYYMNQFTPVLNWSVTTGSYDSGSVTALNYYDDGSYFVLAFTSAGGTKTLNATFVWNATAANITQMDFYWLGEGSATQTITFSVLNRTSGANIILGSVNLPATAGTGASGKDTLFTARIPDIPNTVNSTTGAVTIRLFGSSASGGLLYNNLMTMKAFKNSTYITEVKGASEVHIYSLNISGSITAPPLNVSAVWNYENRTLTDYNLSETKNYLSSINSTVDYIYSSNLAILYSVLQINNTVTSINITSTSILSYLVGIIQPKIDNIYSVVLQTFNLSVNINSTVNEINAKNYTPTIIVNVTVNTTNTTNIFNYSYLTENNNTFIYNYTVNVTVENVTNIYNYTQNITFDPVFNVTVNTTQVTVNNVTVVVNETNTTNIYNYSYLTENNNTFIYNYSYLTENNNTFIYNYSYLTENNFTIVYNFSYLTENNFTIVYNSTYNATYNYSYLTENNFTIIYNYTQNVTFVVDNITNIFNYSYLTENNNSFFYNYSYLTENNNSFYYNFTTYFNYSYLTENNFTVVFNNTYNYSYFTQINSTVIYNFTYENNNTFIYNTTVTVNNVTVDYQVIANHVWNNTQRTLTDYNQSEIIALLNSLNMTVGEVLPLLLEVNQTDHSILAYVMSINDSQTSQSNSLSQIVAVVTDTNATVYANYNLLVGLGSTTSQIYSNLNTVNNTVNNIYGDTQSIIATLYNLSVGNISVMANVNVSEIVEAVYGADVQEFVITSTPALASQAPPITGDFLGGVAYAASSGVVATCVDNTTLLNSISLVRCVNNVCNNIQSNVTEFCQYGCASDVVPNACVQAPSQINVLFIIILVIAALFILGGYMVLRQK